MRYLYPLLSTPFFAALFLGAALSQEQKTQKVPGWGTFFNPDSDCKVKADQGKLTITIPKTWHDLTYTDDYNKVNAPRVLKKVHGDFRVQVKVDGFPFPENGAPAGGNFSFRSAGLLIWQNDKNFIRMERAAAGPGAFVWVEGFKDGKSLFQDQAPAMGQATNLRVERSGKKFSFLVGEGATWTEVGSRYAEL